MQAQASFLLWSGSANLHLTALFTTSVIQRFLRWPTSEVCPSDDPNFLSRATFYKTSEEGLDFAFICPSTFSFSLCLDNGEKQKGLFQSDGKLIRACAISQTLPLWFPCPLLLYNRNRLVCKGWWAWKCWWQMYFQFPSVFLNCSSKMRNCTVFVQKKLRV